MVAATAAFSLARLTYLHQPYIHIPGHGWWYAVTVIDYFSRYLLAIHLTSSYSATEVKNADGAVSPDAEDRGGLLASL